MYIHPQLQLSIVSIVWIIAAKNTETLTSIPISFHIYRWKINNSGNCNAQNIGIIKRFERARWFWRENAGPFSQDLCFFRTENVQYSPPCTTIPIRFNFDGPCFLQAKLWSYTTSLPRPTITGTTWPRETWRPRPRFMRAAQSRKSLKVWDLGFSAGAWRREQLTLK